MYFSGQNILGSDYILMVEDSDNDNGRDVYLLDAQGDDNYTQYEPFNLPPPVTNLFIAGFRTTGNFVDLYVSFSALGGPDVSDLSLVWATDQENPNLEQGPIVDSLDFSDTPILLNADLNVLKDVDEHNPSANDPITYTVTVTNTGPATATNIELTDQLPAGVIYQGDSATQGIYDINTDIWSVGTLANEGIATLTIEAIVDSPFTLNWTNTATITSVDQPDPHVGDNSDSATIYPGAAPDDADLSVIKDVDKHLPIEGDTITYTFIVTNTGPATATNINMTDQLPVEVTYQGDSASQGTYDSGSGIWSIGNLADGASATLTITGILNCACGTTVSNTATVIGAEFDPHLGDNSDIAEFVAQAPAPVVATGVPVFPSTYVGLAAALGAGVIAYLLHRRVLGRKATEI